MISETRSTKDNKVELTYDDLVDTLKHELTHVYINEYIDKNVNNKDVKAISDVIKAINSRKEEVLDSVDEYTKGRLEYVLSFADSDMTRAVKELISV